MVTDSQGGVSVVREGKASSATLAAELAPPARVELAEGARLSLLELASGDELLLVGPATAEVKAGGIEATPRERLSRRATKLGPVKVREGALTRAAMILRNAPQIERLPLLAPVNGVLLETRPRFRWAAVDGVGPYRFELTDEKGGTLHEARVAATEVSLPDTVELKDGTTYAWEVSARRPDGVRFASFAEFSIAPKEVRERAVSLRPAPDAPVSAWTSYALWLDSQSLAGEARSAWAAVARLRPGDEMARKLATQ
jgi:hypothetical protein